MDDGRLPARASGGGSADEAQRSAALEDAVTLLLRHRLFPRAMAWNVQQNVAAPEDVAAAEQAAMAQYQTPRASEAMVNGFGMARATLEPQFPTAVSGAYEARDTSISGDVDRYPGPTRADALDMARSFPLLQASACGAMGQQQERNDEYRLALEVKARAERRARIQGPLGFQQSSRVEAVQTAAPPSEARERLFRTMGKYLDGRSSTMGSGTSGMAPPSSGFGHQPPMYQQVVAPLSPPAASAPQSRYGRAPSPDRRTLEQQTAFQALKISSYTEELTSSQLSPPLTFSVPRTPAEPRTRSPSRNTTSSASDLRQSPTRTHLRSPSQSSSGSTSGKKRSRGSTSSSHNTNNTIAPSLARALLKGCGAKRCSFGDCNKIAVSKGLCRGHGGGRRCQHAGCTKCAQSRSPFCWAHGGGKRCEAPNCRRSRKTKRFCVDHVEMELTVPLKPEASNAKSSSAKTPKTATSPASARSSMKNTSANATVDSDDSIGDKSTVSCDSNLSAIQNKENSKRNGVTEQRTQVQYQYQQYAGEQSGFLPPPSLQLPSLNEALLRTLPAKQAVGGAWSSTPSPPAPSPSQYKSDPRSWPRSTSEADPSFQPPSTSR